MQKLSPAARALLLSSFVAGNPNPPMPPESRELTREQRKAMRNAFSDKVRLDPMFRRIDEAEPVPARYVPAAKAKRVVPFVNHQARYRKLKRQRTVKP